MQGEIELLPFLLGITHLVLMGIQCPDLTTAFFIFLESLTIPNS